MYRFKQLVGLGNFQRRVIRKHHASRAETNPRSHSASVRNQDFGTGARDAGHVVVLGVPETRVAEAIDRLREFGHVAERTDTGVSTYQGNKIKCRERKSHDASSYLELRSTGLTSVDARECRSCSSLRVMAETCGAKPPAALRHRAQGLVAAGMSGTIGANRSCIERSWSSVAATIHKRAASTMCPL